jgi:hypothetical protein
MFLSKTATAGFRPAAELPLALRERTGATYARDLHVYLALRERLGVRDARDLRVPVALRERLGVRAAGNCASSFVSELHVSYVYK